MRQRDGQRGSSGVQSKAKLAVRARAREVFSSLGSIDPVDLHANLLSEFERPLLEVTLEKTGGNQLRAAQILGINRNTLRKKLLDLGLAARRGGPGTGGTGD